jgi:hypothetical protein
LAFLYSGSGERVANRKLFIDRSKRMVCHNGLMEFLRQLLTINCMPSAPGWHALSSGEGRIYIVITTPLARGSAAVALIAKQHPVGKLGEHSR